MASDSFQVVTSRSWMSRIGGAIKGVIFGLVLFFGALVLLFWNEGRAVERYKTLKEGGGSVVSIAADRVDQGNEGKLVHVSGRAESGGVVVDPEFAVRAKAIKIIRSVEMYQWAENSRSETRKKLGGGEETVTTYTYEKRWSERRIDSSGFKQPEGHGNPQMPYQSETFVAPEVRLGAFRLPRFLVDQINVSRPLQLSDDVVAQAKFPPRAKRHETGLYLGFSADSPQLGDIRVSYSVVEDTEVSLAAEQHGDSFKAYKTKAGGTIALLQIGQVPAEAMFAQAQQSNTMLTWVLRVGGFVLMFIGFRMILGPLAVLSDVVPAIGSLVGSGVSMISGVIAAVLSTLTIAIAWIVYRPLLGISLVVLAAVVGFFIVGKVRKATPAAVPPPSPHTPPPIPGG
jgi:hypothetical protein